MNTIFKPELIDRISAKLKIQQKEKFVVGGNKHTYQKRYNLTITEAIIAKVLDAFWEVVADTITNGDKIQVQHYLSIYPKYITNGKADNYCVKVKVMERLKRACKILTENEKREEIHNE